MDTKELIEKFGIRANKNFGQNFLHRQDIIDSIVHAAKGSPCALEIGVGLGVLSAELCRVFDRVTTVEIDRSLKEVTDYTLGSFKNHTLIYQNFLKTDIGELCKKLEQDKLTVVGNLPYNITAGIVAKLVKSHTFIDKAVIMVQKEAAQKLAANAGDENYRAVSVLTQYFCDIETVCDADAASFIPPPHVTSRVIKLTFKKDLPVPTNREKDFYIFIQNVFSKRRKLLTASMQKGAEREKAVLCLEKLGLSDKTRAEQMSPSLLAQFFILMFCE
jgi:16S rRNA (adenine1518-N6/adenine1519-N6)-dimethyltransferase